MCGTAFFKEMAEKGSKNRADMYHPRQVKTEMKRKVGKDPGGQSKKGEEVGNESPLPSVFQKQQTDNDLKTKHERCIMQYLRRANSWPGVGQV